MRCCCIAAIWENVLQEVVMLTTPVGAKVVFSNKRRTIALQIVDGQLTVRAPSGVSLKAIQAIVSDRGAWIEKHLSASVTAMKPDYLKLGYIPFQERSLPLLCQRHVKSSAQLHDDVLLVNVSKRVREANVDAKTAELIRHWYSEQALQWFTARVALWQTKMQVQVTAIKVGSWNSKWGYCKSSAEVGFNWRLLMAPTWVADYVVVHELAHLRYLNHSAAFWQFVHRFYPDSRRVKQWLKQHQHQLTI